MRDYKTTSDNELLQLLTQSDHVAYTEIYNRYFYILYVHAYKKLRDEDQAKDVLQDVFATLWFKRESDFQSNNLGGYLYTAIKNRIFNLFAHEQVKSRYIDSLGDFLRTHPNIPADYRIRENQLKAYIAKEIRALPPKMKRIFELSRNEYLSHKEIAEKLGTSENNVATQITSALRILRTKIGIMIFIYFLMIPILSFCHPIVLGSLFEH